MGEGRIIPTLYASGVHGWAQSFKLQAPSLTMELGYYRIIKKEKYANN